MRTGRPLLAYSKLAERILASDEPMYLIAARAKLQPWQLSMYCKGRAKIPPVVMVRLCAALECQPEDLID